MKLWEYSSSNRWKPNDFLMKFNMYEEVLVSKKIHAISQIIIEQKLHEIIIYLLQ